MNHQNIRDSWKIVKTTDVLDGIVTGKKDVNQALEEGEYPFFSCARETTLFSNEAKLDTDAILISGNGSYTGFVKCHSGPFDIYQRTYALHDFREGVDWKFIYYIFKHYFEKAYMGGTSGAAIPYITKPIITNFEFAIPKDYSEQRKISKTLSAYDDLIDNNRRRIELLEEAARLLYREWFIHFRFPGYEHVEFIDGVPGEWEQGMLEELLILQRGFDLPVAARNEGDVPVYGSSGIVGYHDVAKANAPMLITGRSGSLGQVAFVSVPCWPLNTALWVKEFRKISPWFAYFLLSELGLEKFNGGASVPTLDRKVVHRLNVALPSAELLNAFDELVKPSFAMIDALKIQNGQLAKARDLLLPRLMDGRLEI